MIESFRIKNFKSYRDETTIDFTASDSLRAHSDHLIERGGSRLIKMTGIFGANSAGKSNLIKALRAVHSFVTGSADVSVFTSFASNEKDISEFCLRFITDRGNHLEYTLQVCHKYIYNEVVSERLILLNDSQAAIVFERDQGILSDILEVYRHVLNKDPDENFERQKKMLSLLREQSFLSKYWSENPPFYSHHILHSEMDSVMNDVKEWFLNTIQFIDTSRTYLPKYESSHIEEISDYVCDFGADIEDIYWKDVTDLERIDRIVKSFKDDLMLSGLNNIPNDARNGVDRSIILSDDANIYHFISRSGVFYVQELRVKHRHGSGFDSPVSSESMGTRRMIQLVSTLLNDFRSRVYIIDELNYKLHPMMTRRFIELFGQIDNNAQLIFTSHEMNIFTSDLFRLDELIIIDKDDFGHSKIMRVSDHDDIMTDTLKNMYLENGEFGGIPRF